MSAFGPWTRLTKKLKTIHSEPDSLDTVELIMALEEIFDLNLDGILQDAMPFHQMVDTLWWQIAGQPPNIAATRLLKKIAIRDSRPEIEGQPDEPWRKEQIEALLQELLDHR